MRPVYDIETYPNIFTLAAKDPETGNRYKFEISWRVDHRRELMQFLLTIAANGGAMIGFNNLGFDYPVLHYIIENLDHVQVDGIYNKAMSIIRSQNFDKFGHMIWEKNRYVPQIDLFKIHHFDNHARATSLKALEFAMRRKRVMDLPFAPGKYLTWDECDQLVHYNDEDVDATCDFLEKSQEQIAFRQQLTEQYDRDFMNHNDTKIGKDYFVMELERAGVPCYHMVDGKRQPRQTPRPHGIRLADVILPYVQFQQPEFQRVLAHLQRITITNTKAPPELKGLCATINGFQFDFGTGGIHGSLDGHVAVADDDCDLEDVDVTSYYPNLAIANRFFPAHLSDKFCDIYQTLFERRKGTKKGSAENAMLKLALNGVYGDSGNEYGPFYDPQYTMSITINGQLLLCMLAEQLMVCPDVQLLQINTDGLTIRYPKHLKPWVHDLCTWWEGLTRLSLESNNYSRVWIADVNNYIAEYTDGKLKRKGRYEYKMGWHQDASALVVPMAAEAHLVRGENIRSFIENHADMHDFMIRGKAPRSSRMVLVDYLGVDHLIQNMNRYFVSPIGGDMIKIMPPLKGKTEERRINQCAGWKVLLANDLDTVNPDDIDTDYYVKEAEKLVAPFRRKP